MDIKQHISAWFRAIEENPSVAVLIVIIVIAVVLFSGIYLDGYLKNRKRQKLKQRGKSKK